MKSKSPIRTQLIMLMLAHHILTMAAIQYESVLPSDLVDRMVILMDSMQQLPINEI